MEARECQIVQLQWVISMKREKEDQKDRWWQIWNILKTILRHFISLSMQQEEDFRATNMLQEDYSEGMLNRQFGTGERLKARMVLSSYLHQRKFGSGLELRQEMQKRINARQQRSNLSVVSGKFVGKDESIDFMLAKSELQLHQCENDQQLIENV